MSQQLTKVIKQNLKLYFSENNLDTEDGGGLRSSRVLSGKENELFDPIGSVSNTMGNYSMKLTYAGVDRTDAEPLLEAGFIIAEPPLNPAVSFIAFMASYYGEMRKNAVNRVEANSIKTIESRMTLLTKQMANSRMLMAYQMIEEPDPKVGEVYCLDQEKTGYDTKEEYIKIRKVETEIREFFDSQRNTYFKRKVVKIEITAPLTADFFGADSVSESYQKPPCVLREAMVADAGRYFGVKKLKRNITAGESIVHVDSIFEKIVPSSETPVALTNKHAGSFAKPIINSQNEIQKAIGVGVMFAGQEYYIGTAIARGSFKIGSATSDTYSDSSGKLIRITDNVEVADINYDDGTITPIVNFNPGGYARFKSAVRERRVSTTAAISVTDINQTNVYTMTLDPSPMAGSVTVSYRSQGNWYDLTDDGTGVLSGGDGHGMGNYDSVTKTLTIETAALPDVGSEIIIFYATPASYFDRSNIAIDAPIFKAELEHTAIQPSTVQVTYLDDSQQQQTVTDDGAGAITGSNFTAQIDYADGHVTFSYTNLPLGGAEYQFNYSYGNQLTKPFIAPNRNADGTITFNLNQTNITTFRMRWNVDIETFDYISTTPAEMQVKKPIDPYIDVSLDSSGNLFAANGQNFGTLNKSTGIGTFTPEATVKIPVGRYNVQEQGLDESGNIVYKNLFIGWEYINAGVSMPIGPNGKVDTWFSAAGTANNHSMSSTLSTLDIDLTPLYSENIVAQSVFFEMGGKTYTDSDGKMYYNHDFVTNNSSEAGTTNYATGVTKISAWVPGQSASISLKSLTTSLDKNPVDEVVFRTAQAPIKPMSLQLTATTLQGDTINVTADSDGLLTGQNISGKVEVADGVVRCRFGEWVIAAGNESEIWYSANAIVDSKIFKPVPVFADSLRYNAVAYTYLPLDSSVIGINTVRFPADGRVPIYRPGDMIVVAARYHQNLGSAFSVGSTHQLNVINLSGCCITDDDGVNVDATKYSVDLDTGIITFSDSDLTDYKLPLHANYSIEEERAVSNVDIAGGLKVTRPLDKSYDKDNTYVSSMMIGGDMQVRATKPFSQTTWDNIWADERRGNELLVKLDTKNYPIVLTDQGSITDDWLIIFRGGLQIDLYSRAMGHIVTTDWLQDLAPDNPAGGKYFVLPKEAFGPTNNPRWAAGNCVRFKTYGALIMPWIIRSVQPNGYQQVGKDGATLQLRGNTVEITQ